MLIKKYTQYFSIAGAYVGQLNLKQYSVLLWVNVDVVDNNSRVATGYSLNFLNNTLLNSFDLIFKKIFPKYGSIPRAAR